MSDLREYKDKVAWIAENLDDPMVDFAVAEAAAMRGLNNSDVLEHLKKHYPVQWARAEGDGIEMVTEFKQHFSNGTPILDRMESELAPRPKIQLLPANELTMKPVSWTVHRYLEREAIIFMYGESQAFKTFICLDIACCVALGIPWGPDCQVRQGPVVYVCGEGAGGIRRRLEAWSIHNNQPIPDNLYISSCSTNLSDENAVADLRAEIDSLPEPPAMINVDTMARNFGGVENDSYDIGRFYSQVEHNFVKPYGCSVLVTHHPGKDVSRGARGSASIKQNSDAMFQVERDDSGTQWFTKLVGEKMKDAPIPDTVTFEAKKYLLDVFDEYGEQGSSLAMDYVSPTEVRMIQATEKKEQDSASLLYRKALLKEIIKDNTMTQRDYSARASIPNGSVSRHMEWLRKNDYLRGSSGKLTVTAKGRVWVGFE